MNPHAGNGGDILKHVTLALAVNAALKGRGGLALYAETHGGLPHNDLAVTGYRYPAVLLNNSAGTQLPQSSTRAQGPMPYVHDYCNTQLTGPDGGYQNLLRVGLPDPINTKKRRATLGQRGTWYPGSVGLVAELTRRRPLSHLLVRDTAPAASTDLGPLFPKTNVVAGIGGGLDADSLFVSTLRRALTYRRPTDSKALILIDPFNLAGRSDADAVESRRLLWELAAHPARPVVFAWYPIAFVRGEQLPPTPTVIDRLWAGFDNGPHPA